MAEKYQPKAATLKKFINSYKQSWCGSKFTDIFETIQPQNINVEIVQLIILVEHILFYFVRATPAFLQP